MHQDDFDREEYTEGSIRQFKRRPDLVPTKIGWKCKGICSRLDGASRGLPINQQRGSVYRSNVRCTTCSIYIPIKYVVKAKCPCCNIKTRVRPRNNGIMKIPRKKAVVRY